MNGNKKKVATHFAGYCNYWQSNLIHVTTSFRKHERQREDFGPTFEKMLLIFGGDF